jgi:DNA-binding response OmpR family regulator
METSARRQIRVQGASASAVGRRNGEVVSVRSKRDTSVETVRSADDTLALRVAIVDRDSGFLVVLAKRLERAEWEHRVLPVKTSIKALAAFDADVIIVDPAVLGPRYWSWLERVCDQLPELRIIVCTASSTVAERVRALRLGVDDWLSKPCHPEELLARIEAVTAHRRRPETEELEPVTLGEVEIRPGHFQAFVHGESLGLTRREYQLIQLLSRADGEVLARESIYECLWGYEMTRNDRSVDVFVHKLRRKLESASPDWCYIHTHFGIGYRLAAESAQDAAVCELSPVGVQAASSESRLAA